MIIFISGSINAGKSTVAKIVAGKIKNCAILEIDDLRQLVSWLPIDQAVPICLKNTVFIIKKFSQKKIDVVVPYPLSEKNYRYLKKSLKGLKEKIYFFTLNPDLKSVLRNRGTRKLSVKEKNRIKYHYQIGINQPSFGITINNTNQTANQTAKIILKNIK